MSDGQAIDHRTSLVSRMKAVFLTWLENPTSVASVCPSSKVLTKKIANRQAVRDAKAVVDLGPATGETSVALLEQMRPDARLLAVEKMAEFMPPLSEIEDERMIAQHGDAVELGAFLDRHEFPKADVIVSGIPFSTMNADEGERIIDAIHSHLSDGGVFIAYQVRDDVKRLAALQFGTPEVEKVRVNVPPLTIYVWVKSPTMAAS